MSKYPVFDPKTKVGRLEKRLWEAADKLRKNIDAAEYKHIVLGLIFLKYISDPIVEQRSNRATKINSLSRAFGKDGYLSSNLFSVPSVAHWSHLEANSQSPKIGRLVDKALDALESVNPSLKGVLPKVFSGHNLDPASLGSLIDLIGGVAMGEAKERSQDVLGHVFEYFLGEFALGEGRKGGQFYTPKSVVELLVETLEPYKGRVFDPCCGSGGMFVQSEKFVAKRKGSGDKITIYGQESNLTTWRLAKMNLAIRGLDSSEVKWNPEGSFLRDAHKDLKADYIIANPPFNDSDWGGLALRDDPRWRYGVPPGGNANFAWLQHVAHHLAPNGQAGVVLAKGALTSQLGGEGEIRRQMIENGNLVDCVVTLPTKLFLNTQIPAALWFLSADRAKRPRRWEILFIDARRLGEMITRRTRALTSKDIEKISGAYHRWRDPKAGYADEIGFCRSTPIALVKEQGYALTPGNYVERLATEEDFDYKERLKILRIKLDKQLKEEKKLNETMMRNLDKLNL
ncbi:MAG: type I restriction-modification system subunit M [Deltaproteobacteria bacterium]|jgi:type I restriction enzyme M protein|nr:type I restriction-modification system subunit M [Deltaproteobacteria bacterium]